MKDKEELEIGDVVFSQEYKECFTLRYKEDEYWFGDNYVTSITKLEEDKLVKI